MVTKLSKVGEAKDSSLQLYNEAATTMEKLAVLKAWAEVLFIAFDMLAPSHVNLFPVLERV